MSEWSIEIDEIFDIQPLQRVADEKEFTIDEDNKMALGTLGGQDVFLENMDSDEALPYVLADELNQQLQDDFAVRTPRTLYEHTREVSDLEGAGGLLATENIDRGGDISDLDPRDAVKSLVDTYAFLGLIGQADLNTKNTETDFLGFYAFDFSNAGRSILQVYDPLKTEAEEKARYFGLDAHIDDYDVIGERIGEMAQTIDEAALFSDTQERLPDGSYQAEYEIRKNIVRARRINYDAPLPDVLQANESAHDDAVIID